jgi:DNA-binding NarL/FixJ family response regulator
MESPKVTRVYIADDHQVLVDGLKSLLTQHDDIEIVGTASNGVSLLEKATFVGADLLILDINMPQVDGIMVLKEYAVNKLKTPKILLLSSYDDLKVIREALKLGARGYLTKDSAGENIIVAVRSIMNGQDFLTDEIRQKIYQNFTHQSVTEVNETSINQAYPVSMLTQREIDIIRLIALEYSSKEIADELHISIFTVDTHRKNLMKKIQVKSTIGLIKYAVKNQII